MTIVSVMIQFTSVQFTSALSLPLSNFLKASLEIITDQESIWGTLSRSNYAA